MSDTILALLPSALKFSCHLHNTHMRTNRTIHPNRTTSIYSKFLRRLSRVRAAFSRETAGLQQLLCCHSPRMVLNVLSPRNLSSLRSTLALQITRQRQGFCHPDGWSCG